METVIGLDTPQGVGRQVILKIIGRTPGEATSNANIVAGSLKEKLTYVLLQGPTYEGFDEAERRHLCSLSVVGATELEVREALQLTSITT